MMTMATKMLHYWKVNSDGTVHVSNWVGAHEGQHHVHTQEGFGAWKANGVEPDSLRPLKGEEDCDCGLLLGLSIPHR